VEVIHGIIKKNFFECGSNICIVCIDWNFFECFSPLATTKKIECFSPLCYYKCPINFVPDSDFSLSWISVNEILLNVQKISKPIHFRYMIHSYEELYIYIYIYGYKTKYIMFGHTYQKSIFF